MSQFSEYSARAWNMSNLVMNVSISVEPCLRDNKAYLFQSFSFVDQKFSSTRSVNFVQVHCFSLIISFSKVCAKVPASLPTKTTQKLSMP